MLEFFFALCYNNRMIIDLSPFKLNNKIVAVAVSGGLDSMSLLHYMQSNAKHYNFKLVAVNVEHGIRGESSINDSLFVAEYCYKNDIPLFSFSVDSVQKAKTDKLSIEQSARILRYECFYQAIADGKCDIVATAHHRGDLCESVLLNLFRGTGIKGLSGIKSIHDDKIIRPMLNVGKDEIELYAKDNNIPFVTDETNFSDEYTRNFLRLNVIPKIKEVFPELEKSVERLSGIAKAEDEFMDECARTAVKIKDGVASIPVDTHDAVLKRAVIIALKGLGLEKDWAKTHADAVCGLKNLENGAKVYLPNYLYATREYDYIVITENTEKNYEQIPFSYGTTQFGEYKIYTQTAGRDVDLKSGFYCDLNKIPSTAIIRTKRDGDIFTKFGGGTKSLGDFLTDKKIPLRIRERLPVLADGNVVLCVFSVAVSDKIKVDDNTQTIIKLICE